MRTTFTKNILTACILFLSGFLLRAQVSSLYTFTQFPGSYSSINGGTLINTSAFDDQDIVDGLGTGIIPNNLLPPAVIGPGINIGFTFMYDNQPFDRIGISNNGYVIFGNSVDGPQAIYESLLDWNRPISSTSPTPPKNQYRIAAFGTDLLSKVTSNIRVQTLGTAPTRTCVIQWSDYQIFIASPTGFDNINFQLRLYETTNIIDVIYGTIYSPTLDSIAQVGLRGGINTDFNNRSVTPPLTWTNSVAGASNLYFARYNTTLFPPSGLTYRWSPPQCAGTLAVLNTTATVASTCPSSTLALGLQNTYTVSGISYTWSSSTSSSSGPYTSIPGANTNAIASMTSGISAWYQLSSTCLHSGVTTTSTPFYVTVAQAPTITAAASAPTICSGANLTLTATGNATAYAWTGGYTTGIGFPATVSNTFIVTGTNAIGCTSTAAVPVTVVPTPNQSITVTPSLICDGGTATLTSPPATNYTWTSATQTVFTTSLITPTLAPGNTTYAVTKSNANCFSTQTITVYTNSLPAIFAFANPTLVCGFGSSTLNIAGAQNYTWTSPPPNSFTFTGNNPVVSPLVPSTYTVAASDGSCTTISTLFVNTNANPTITINTNSSTICNGETVTLTANGGNSYTWTSTSGGTVYTQTFTDTPSTATSYQVTGDNSAGCISSTTQVVFVNPIPTISIVASKSLVCSGGATTLTANGASTYTWDANANSALTPTTVISPTSAASSSFIYTVQGTNTFSCQGSNTVQVNVFVPVLSVVGTTNTCSGGLISLTVTGGNPSTYTWNTGTGTFPSALVSTTINAPGTFTVNATASSGSVTCPATKTVPVGIYPNPSITAVAERTTICKNELVDLTATGGISYTWTSSSSHGATITVSPQNATNNYTVTGVDINNCVNNATVQVKVSACNGIEEWSTTGAGIRIYPNPSSGAFTIQGQTGMELMLINELGQILRAISLSQANDYKASVTDLPGGIYFVTGTKDNMPFSQKLVITK